MSAPGESPNYFVLLVVKETLAINKVENVETVNIDCSVSKDDSYKELDNYQQLEILYQIFFSIGGVSITRVSEVSDNAIVIAVNYETDI